MVLQQQPGCVTYVYSVQLIAASTIFGAEKLICSTTLHSKGEESCHCFYIYLMLCKGKHLYEPISQIFVKYMYTWQLFCVYLFQFKVSFNQTNS